MMKTILLTVVLAAFPVLTLATPKAKPVSPLTSVPACANDVCLNMHQHASIALAKARIDVILLRRDEQQGTIPSALDAMTVKAKAARQEINSLYVEALKTASKSPPTAQALKNYMKVFTAAINAYPLQTAKETPQREAEHGYYEAKLNDAWAEVQIEAGI